MARPRETAKTKLVRLLLLLSNAAALLLGLALGYVGRSLADQYELGEAAAVGNGTRHSTNNATDGTNGSSREFTLLGAEQSTAPYRGLMWFAAITVLTSLLGIFGACRASKYTGRHRGALLIYYWVVVIATAGCIWISVMCIIFAARTEQYIERYLLSAWKVLTSADTCPPSGERQTKTWVLNGAGIGSTCRPDFLLTPRSQLL